MKSLRWRLIGGIVLVISTLWAATAAWFFVDVRAELSAVLDARMIASAQMVQGLLDRQELRLPNASRLPLNPPPRPAGRPTGLVCQLWTLDGRLVSTADGGPPLPATAIPDGISNQRVNGRDWRVFALTDPEHGLRILTAEPRQLRRNLMLDMALKLSAPLALALPAMLLLVWLAVRRALVPLERLRRSLQARGPDALEPLAVEGLPAELSPMVNALNGLLRRLSEAFARERRFTGDAAHELRTPLAGIKTQLQIAQGAGGDVRARALAQAEAGLDRMSRLVTQMLMLARVEARQAISDGQERAPVQATLTAVLEELRPLAEQQGVNLQLRGETSDAVAPLPPLMLHTALRNLLENALRHGGEGGRVDVRVNAGATQTVLQVLDTGPGIADEELNRVQARFYRTAAGKATGTGLGLSIVAAIARRYDLGFRLRNRDDGPGLCASLTLTRQRGVTGSDHPRPVPLECGENSGPGPRP
ncbi:ATP-binding protein [Alkalilimnicola sp. S0819]|uniref:ATP-binding protein n=1 Tax=Alkalilimnicola sp. S0819 TaxID=2613922 RepID=UPI001261D47F|nr:ATP-binding protein [Alkalilimnicola sp. S0819]KAB7623413.1 two-component sensor histidine kinase [Alkalilimnicola sp. S0819]MPQ16959.1 two-component sensor histidine kinase [Alkalilimnicola sp. S0819]